MRKVGVGGEGNDDLCWWRVFCRGEGVESELRRRATKVVSVLFYESTRDNKRRKRRLKRRCWVRE